MTDAELIARLRDGCNLQQRDGERAAKRIEQLIATNEALTAERDEWMKDSAAAWDKCEARRIDEEVLEAKLAKAAAFLEEIAITGDWFVSDMNDLIKELKGESQDGMV